MEQQVEERVPEMGTRVLTKEDYSTLLNMIRSSDPHDHTMAQLILIQLDVEKSIYLIWKLAKAGNASRMVNLRTKAGRKFRDDSALFSIHYMNEKEFANWLNTRGWLTKELYQKLKPGIRTLIKKTIENPFYDFHITIKPEFKAFDEEDQLTSISSL